ncbi:hypothetical protein LPJ74_005886 [Coemansia sp. RSA 1843]|nr:hypothetical protein LPJ74_005886 [Coemansia sp. RSA 1843]
MVPTCHNNGNIDNMRTRFVSSDISAIMGRMTTLPAVKKPLRQRIVTAQANDFDTPNKAYVNRYPNNPKSITGRRPIRSEILPQYVTVGILKKWKDVKRMPA